MPLVVLPLKKNIFLCVSSLRQAVKNTPSNLDSPNLKKKVYVFFFLNCPPIPSCSTKKQFFYVSSYSGQIGAKKTGCYSPKKSVSGHYRHYRLKKKWHGPLSNFFFLNCPSNFLLPPLIFCHNVRFFKTFYRRPMKSK